jgi:hypothetical protein
MRRFLVLALFACVPAVALADKAPWSEIDGSVVDATQGDLAPVAVVKIGDKALAPCRGGADSTGQDGKTTGSLFDSFNGDRKKVACVDPTRRLKIAPGVHATKIATTRLAKGGALATQSFALTAEPCMRYRLVARHAGPGAKRFAVEVAVAERIDSCTLPTVAAALDTAADTATDTALPVAPATQAAPVQGAAGGTPQR